MVLSLVIGAGAWAWAGVGVGVTSEELLSADGAGPLWVPCEPSTGACIEASWAATFWVFAGVMTAVFGSAGAASGAAAALVLVLTGAAEVSLEVVG